LIELELKSKGIEFVKEYRFHSTRRFRFDIAILEHRIAVEYEGIFSAKSRHTSIKGYTKDCEKYNLATVNGWRVLRYTAKNYGQAVSDVMKIIYNKD
jgi:very-short-patch-repair endonuclease